MKSKNVALLLNFFLGNLGVHRFYVGKVGTGILYLLTCGMFGIGSFIDLILICTNNFKDKDGNPLEGKVSSLVVGVIIAYMAFVIIGGITAGIAYTFVNDDVSDEKSNYARANCLCTPLLANIWIKWKRRKSGITA